MLKIPRSRWPDRRLRKAPFSVWRSDLWANRRILTDRFKGALRQHWPRSSWSGSG